MMTKELPEMKVTGVMHFASRPHLTYTLHDTQYISMRPLVDQIGLDWRTQKKGLLDDDAVMFYGTLLLENGEILQAPCKYSLKNDVSPSPDSEKGQKTAILCSDDAQKDTVFIRLHRVYMYLARISIANIKAKGNMSSAEYLLSLQEEWAEALHDYETNGFAVKASHAKFESSKVRDFLAVCKEKRMTSEHTDRQVLHSLMKDMAQKIGHPFQSDLVDD